MTMTKLKSAIEHFKVDSGMTNDDIAKLLGVSPATFFAKVSGESQLNIRQAKQLADLMGMTLEEFYVICC